ncbi:MAG: hypothetical protein ACI9CZ_001274, partial [Flavobacterium sp.]
FKRAQSQETLRSFTRRISRAFRFECSQCPDFKRQLVVFRSFGRYESL